MKGYFPHLLVSISLAVINEASTSRTPIRDALRNKRSFVSEAGHKRQQGLPEYTKRSKIPSYGLHKRNGLDTLDLDALFDDPMFADLMADEAKDNHFSFTFPEFEPEPLHPHPPHNKEGMSNVIPGALGPMVEEPRAGGAMQDLSGQMLDDFLWFLELKESGLLNSCMAIKRR